MSLLISFDASCNYNKNMNQWTKSLIEFAQYLVLTEILNKKAAQI